LFLLLPPLMQVLPVLVLILGALGQATPDAMLWATIASAATLLWWIVVYVTIGENPLYALAYPLGALVLLYIFVTAVMRGRRVTWKGRTYIAE
jgi:hypothetical protein